MSDTEKKKIHILLMRFPNIWSKMIGIMTNSYYNHASIGLEEDYDTYYSFLIKGFIVESITKYLKPDIAPFPCELYEIEVSAKQYDIIKKTVLEFAEKKHTYKFALVELIFGLARMPIIRKNKYYCSQFVADVLKISGVLQSKRNSARYFPKDFCKIEGANMIFKGDLLEYVKKFVSMSSAA